MDFMDVISALEVIKSYCKETPDCKQCRLHTQNDNSTCGVSPLVVFQLVGSLM